MVDGGSHCWPFLKALKTWQDYHSTESRNGHGHLHAKWSNCQWWLLIIDHWHGDWHSAPWKWKPWPHSGISIPLNALFSPRYFRSRRRPPSCKAVLFYRQLSLNCFCPFESDNTLRNFHYTVTLLSMYLLLLLSNRARCGISPQEPETQWVFLCFVF